MVLRSDAIRERLKKLEEALSRLREIGQVDRETFRSDYRQSWLAERGLEIACQATLDIGAHILAGHYGESPATYEDILRRLEQRQVVDPSLGERLRGVGGFRNILVHGYLTVDPDRVYEALQRGPRDFTDFQAAILAWLDRLPKI